MGVSISQKRYKESQSDTDSGYVSNCQLYDKIGIPDEIPGDYPSPAPPPNKRPDILSDAECAEADFTASQIDAESSKTLEDLVMCLTQPFSKESQKVRAIFRWVGYQTMHEHSYPDDVCPMSVVAHLKRLSDKTLSSAALITTMCRYADIPCVLIRGIAKSAAYEVGDQRVEHLRNVWNAVYVACGWRLLFPMWAFSAIVGRSTGVWMLVESKGRRMYKRQNSFEGEMVQNVNEYYFFVNPEEFVYRCLPDDERWQLLSRPFTLEEFISVPYLRPNYFKHQLQIISTFAGRLKSEKGLCKITIKHLNTSKKVVLNYELFFNHGESNNKSFSSNQLDKYAAILNDKDRTHVVIRFPVIGEYKLHILDNNQEWVCFFKLTCDEVMPKCEPYPVYQGIGFGPCRKTFDAGLVCDSHKGGEIHVRRRGELDIRFHLTRPVSICTFLVHNSIPSDQLQQKVSHNIEDDKLFIRVETPENGEYALIINSKAAGSEEEYTNTCNYLLTTEASRRAYRNWETAREKLIRRKLQSALTNEARDPVTIKCAVEEFEDIGLQDHGELKSANERIDYLEVSNALNNAINRRNLELLENALADSKSSNYQKVLGAKIQKAEALAERLRNLKLFTHDILDMKQSTVSEIHRYKKPNQAVHDVMAATFLLLGDDENKVKNWWFLQAEMRKYGKSSLLGRIKRLNYSNVSKDIACKAQQYISVYDKETVTLHSAGAGTFFVWVQSVVNEVMTSHT